MSILDEHPYLLGALSVLLVLGGGAYVVLKSIPVSPASGGLQAWSGGGTSFTPGGYGSGSANEGFDRAGLMQQVQGGAPYDYTLPVLPNSTADIENSTGFDFDAFVSLLSSISGPTTTPSNEEADTSAYAYIPTGLVSASAYTPPKNATQAALHEYGNEVGSFIQSFESRHTDSSRVLKDQAEDRTNTAKAAALERLGNDLVALGDDILSIEKVPQVGATLHRALGEGYVGIGTKLRAVTSASSDADFIAAINTYNATADEFIKDFVAVAQLFSTYGVSFTAEEPGSVFMFSPAQL